MSVFKYAFVWNCICILIIIINPTTSISNELSECLITGPGIIPHRVVLPARYFFIQSTGRCNISQAELVVELKGKSEHGPCRVWTQILDRHDGSFIVRYKMFQYCDDMEIHVTWKGHHLAESPYTYKGRIYAEACDCPLDSIDEMIADYQCSADVAQIDNDISRFHNVDFSQVLSEAIKRFSHAGSYSFCHYVVLNNKVHRRCYGQHVGFNMFMDNILLSLSRKAVLPDMEFLINLGDWPLVKKNVEPIIPIFSWCGSSETADIVMPTYDITEASLECMGRVTLDMLSVQSNPEIRWENKQDKAFWRGRDSRRERLNLVKLSRRHPELINASLTNFFFFRDEEKTYGPKEDHISFFKFFDYKYQLNIDGTVAAYRFPYLLAGDAVVFKQDSEYYEHFYSDLKPRVHYIPIKADLSDLVEVIKWAKTHDEEVRQIGANGRQYARSHLLPKDIICYHATLFKKWSQKLKNPVRVLDQMTLVKPSNSTDKRLGSCQCLKEVTHMEL
ncbi:protein O-glucosyltransferase 2 [Daphnia magna]|uniref:protein O-glucosyltransferase 2 n=1 Tax=Daphnia magna TaxID=35525 RepID=UPI001E1BC30B|nr:protein O-glucosyltransferase 2 [Daphnia magna]